MICPVCDDALVIVELGGVELDLCVTCSGLWFDAEELDLLGVEGDDPVASIERELADYAVLGAAQRRCPRCSRHLRRIEAPGGSGPVEIDRCPDGDGLWFDRGELAELFAGSLSEGHPALARVREFLGRFAAPEVREET
jgi:Zn-finger nucleic acid-binding protein